MFDEYQAQIHYAFLNNHTHSEFHFFIFFIKWVLNSFNESKEVSKC